MMIETVTESPAHVDSGDEEIAVVDNEDPMVKDDISMDEMEVQMNEDTSETDVT